MDKHYRCSYCGKNQKQFSFVSGIFLASVFQTETITEDYRFSVALEYTLNWETQVILNSYLQQELSLPSKQSKQKQLKWCGQYYKFQSSWKLLSACKVLDIPAIKRPWLQVLVILATFRSFQQGFMN